MHLEDHVNVREDCQQRAARLEHPMDLAHYRPEVL
jgi:hypothetical protein